MSGSKPPFSIGSGGADRRREVRHDVQTAVVLAVRSPAWAMTPEPISAQTENLSLNGLRVTGAVVPEAPLGAWGEALQEDTEVLVEVSFPAFPAVPALKGRLVWLFEAGPAEEGSVPCSLGFLFSVLREKERRALEEMIQVLQP